MQGLKNFIIRTEHSKEHSDVRTMCELHTCMPRNHIYLKEVFSIGL